MIDIHNHIIPNVDDGSISLDTSISLLQEAKKQGIDKIICTPHYRPHMFETPIEVIKKEFDNLNGLANEIGIDLYLGQEIKCKNCNDIIKFIENNDIILMNNKKILLLEFSYTNDPDINEVIYNARIKGYKVIIAHVERYSYVTLEDVISFKENGAYIQVNADSVLGNNGLKVKKFIKKLIKNNLVDFVASDMHFNRPICYLDSYNYVAKKFGDSTAKKLFIENADQLLIK